MKDAKLNLCNTIIEAFGDTYRARRATLNALEKALYVAALKIAARATLPGADARAAIAEFDKDQAELRDRAEAARAARAAKKEPDAQTPPEGVTASDWENILRGKGASAK